MEKFIQIQFDTHISSKPMSRVSLTQVTEGCITINLFWKLIILLLITNLLTKHQVSLKKCWQDLISAQQIITSNIFISISSTDTTTSAILCHKAHNKE